MHNEKIKSIFSKKIKPKIFFSRTKNSNYAKELNFYEIFYK